MMNLTFKILHACVPWDNTRPDRFRKTSCRINCHVSNHSIKLFVTNYKTSSGVNRMYFRYQIFLENMNGVARLLRGSRHAFPRIYVEMLRFGAFGIYFAK